MVAQNQKVDCEWFIKLEEDTYRKHQEQAEQEIVQKLNLLFFNFIFLSILRQWGAQKGCRYHGHRTIKIRLKSGRVWEIDSPVFIKAPDKKKGRGRPKRRKNVLFHLGLELLGFVDRKSPTLVQQCVTMAVLAPSFKVGAQVLNNLGVQMNPCLLQNIVYNFGEMALSARVACHADSAWKKPHLRIQVCVDAGRIRQRKSKRGRRSKGQKRQGFHTDWIAPWQFVINLFDENGNIIRSTPAIIDGTCGNIDDFFALLEQHLRELNLEEVQEIVFCADGGNGIWIRFAELVQKLGLKKYDFVLDYTHAKQNMTIVKNLVVKGLKLEPGSKEARKIHRKMDDMLWNGDIKGLKAMVQEQLKHKRKLKGKALKKLNEYFGDHEKFQYASCRSRNLPIGSGAIESAIRRVINLRIKSPGMFWKRENAEKMIFLRAIVVIGKLRQAYANLFTYRHNNLSDNELESLPMVA